MLTRNEMQIYVNRAITHSGAVENSQANTKEITNNTVELLRKNSCCNHKECPVLILGLKDLRKYVKDSW